MRWKRPTRPVDTAMTAGFYVLLAASAARLGFRHELDDRLTVVSLALAGVLAVVYGIGIAFRTRLGGAAVSWLLAVLALYIVLALFAPAFAWCAIPLYFLCIQTFPRGLTIVAAVALTGAVIVGQLRISHVLEPSLVLAPIGIAAVITSVMWALDDGIRRREQLIDQLLSTEDSLAQTRAERAVLEERQRLAGEIHDTLAQGLSSISLLLQASQRSGEPGRSAHVEQAEQVAEENLAEARQFVSGLTSPLLRDRPLADALHDLAANFEHRFPLTVRFHEEGERLRLPAATAAALLRVAQGALANIVEHARADEAAVTLTYLDGAVNLDVLDDGIGIGEGASDRSRPGRGFGIATMRRRVEDVGGTLQVESPAAGTVITASVPLREETP
ncbi:sensor histidine kinase [Salininema proteolyticum]|uniref:Oxygen sensor histidine kinase NreB n=1 Tax=Salininema proteolyticum TaxID=1607685 RepID=A0ABV8U0A5_9ACTN